MWILLLGNLEFRTSSSPSVTLHHIPCYGCIIWISKLLGFAFVGTEINCILFCLEIWLAEGKEHMRAKTFNKIAIIVHHAFCAISIQIGWEKPFVLTINAIKFLRTAKIPPFRRTLSNPFYDILLERHYSSEMKDVTSLKHLP